MFQCQGGLTRGHVPELDGEVARRRCQYILSGGVEEDLSNLSISTVSNIISLSVTENSPCMSWQLANGSDIGNFLSVGMQREAFGDLPDEDLSIL